MNSASSELEPKYIEVLRSVKDNTCFVMVSGTLLNLRDMGLITACDASDEHRCAWRVTWAGDFVLGRHVPRSADATPDEEMAKCPMCEGNGLLTKEEQGLAWIGGGDKPLPEDGDIKAAFPTRTDRHDLYGEAMRLVGARHSKGGLLALVNWLLFRLDVKQDANSRLAREVEELKQRRERATPPADDAWVTRIIDALLLGGHLKPNFDRTAAEALVGAYVSEILKST